MVRRGSGPLKHVFLRGASFSPQVDFSTARDANLATSARMTHASNEAGSQRQLHIVFAGDRSQTPLAKATLAKATGSTASRAPGRRVPFDATPLKYRSRSVLCGSLLEQPGDVSRCAGRGGTMLGVRHLRPWTASNGPEESGGTVFISSGSLRKRRPSTRAETGQRSLYAAALPSAARGDVAAREPNEPRGFTPLQSYGDVAAASRLRVSQASRIRRARHQDRTGSILRSTNAPAPDIETLPHFL